MPQVINTNIASLNAQRNLNSSQGSLQTALQRISSGLRINSAKDDAAGLSISQRMSAQVRGLTQAARNANDGISLAQTAEGGLVEITNNLQRIRELAVQAANSTNTLADRQALNSEASQLVSEVTRVATTTQFNGLNLIDGSFSTQQFQVGANANQTISISSIVNAQASSLGVAATTTYSASSQSAAVTTTALSAGDLTLNGYSVGASASDGVSYSSANASAIAKAAAINAISGSSGVTAAVASNTVAFTITTSTGTSTAYSINGVSLGTLTASGTTNTTVTASNIAASINAVSSQTGVTASASGATLTLTASDGRNVTVYSSGADDFGLADATTTGKITLTSTTSTGLIIGGATASNAGLTGATTVTASSSASAGVSSVDLTSISGANAAVATLDSALNTINSARAALGAYQNRFSSAAANLQTSAENISAARSRIMDADFAMETSALTRAQILQQAGVAMLAQANTEPQNVLTLLRS